MQREPAQPAQSNFQFAQTTLFFRDSPRFFVLLCIGRVGIAYSDISFFDLSILHFQCSGTGTGTGWDWDASPSQSNGPTTILSLLKQLCFFEVSHYFMFHSV